MTSLPNSHSALRLTAFTLAGIAAGALVAAIAAQPARALTFENGDRTSTGGSRWMDLDYIDPAKKQAAEDKNKDGAYPRPATGFYFGAGPQNSGRSNFDQNQFFTPNNILGK